MKTTQEKIQIMQAFVDGKQIENDFNRVGEWVDWTIDAEPSWDWEEHDYRIKQASPLIIPWDAIKPEYKWVAKDSNGEVFFYKNKPILGAVDWSDKSENIYYSEIINIQDPDNINWKDSLVERPVA